MVKRELLRMENTLVSAATPVIHLLEKLWQNVKMENGVLQPQFAPRPTERLLYTSHSALILHPLCLYPSQLGLVILIILSSIVTYI